MKSYTTLRNLYGKLTLDTTSANLTFGDELLNDELRRIYAMHDWPFLHKLETLTTVASQQFYPLNYNFELVESVFVTVGSTRYTPKMLHSREEWDRVNLTTFDSDFPVYAFIYDGQLGLWPQPASAGNTISVNGKIRTPDLGIADYTTGKVDIITNGSAAVTGASSPAWTTPMAGRWLRVTHSNTAASSGDGHWYEVSSIGSATTLTLIRDYGGTSLTTGAAASYVLGQMPELPESFHATPVYSAAAVYWIQNLNVAKSEMYKKKFDEDILSLVRQYSSESSDMVLDSGDRQEILNPNLTLTL